MGPPVKPEGEQGMGERECVGFVTGSSTPPQLPSGLTGGSTLLCWCGKRRRVDSGSGLGMRGGERKKNPARYWNTGRALIVFDCVQGSVRERVFP